MILAIILSVVLCFMLLALYSAARVSGMESRKEEERQSKKGEK